MKKQIIKSMVFTSILMIIGCGGDNTNSIIEDTNLPETTSTSVLTQELMDSITHMYSEERLAYDVYMNIYKIQAIQQLQNIAINSETKHIEEVNTLAITYDLNITKYPDTGHPYSTNDLERYGSGEYPVEPIQELYNFLYDKGIQSNKDALEVGCMVEVVDIEDLNEYIKQADESNASDVLESFIILKNGSYKHYATFDEALKKLNDPTSLSPNAGCCSVMESLTNPNTGLEYVWCHPEYLN